MDWTKAKTILIIALLITNLFLGVIYVLAQARLGASEQLMQEETIELLAAKNIFVATEIPLKHNKMPVLNIRYDRLDPTILSTALTKQKGLQPDQRDKDSILGMTEEFLSLCGILSENVVLDKVEENGGTTVITYKNIFEGIPVEDSYIICTVFDGRVTELTRYWLHPLEFGRTKKATMSASAALIHFMGDKDKDSMINVQDIQMVYWLDPSAYGMETTLYDTAFPSWKVTYNGGEVRYIPAYEE